MDDSLNESLKHTGCKNGRTGKFKPYQYSNPMDFIISILNPICPAFQFLHADTGIPHLEEKRMNNAVLKKTIINVVGFVGIVALSGFLQAASFDCARATTNVEKMICSDEKLSNLDEEMAFVYKEALANHEDETGIKSSQINWLTKHRNTCATIDCVRKAHAWKIRILKDKVVEKNNLKIIDNLNPTLCDYLYKLVTKDNKAKELARSPEPLLGLKGVSLPEWTIISREEYLTITNPSLPSASGVNSSFHKPNANSSDRAYYKTKINYDSQGDYEYLLKMEPNDPEKFYEGSFYVLNDEKKPYKNMNPPYGRVFYFNN